ncbi:MAG TPA: cytidylate kinase-like family protein [Chthonomonas sp.]|jgi:cytidylate kinase|uniref:cytidylate kinase-like family protein n=1 Tax=Chthonomonas sp. TaxID=2282153 RepID=UPI002B4AE405|nr:cytidylate kinase-like family protein [Chthonomonas sp.]HLH79132.1 cytidylate kinase-like family protein [Chthonomonas sp.]
MGIITISRQLGAGETTIARAVAERLGWEYVDHNLLDQAVAETGITMPRVVHYDERAPGLLESWQHPFEAEKYFHALQRIFMAYAQKGNVILVGRGGNFILKDADAIHVRLIADMAFRIQRVMEIRWVNEVPAREIIRQSDHDRASFHRHYFQADWENPLNYHLVCNTSRLGILTTIELLVTLARLRWEKQEEDTQ